MKLLLFACAVLHERDAALRREGRNGMLVHHLLTPVTVNYDREIIECFNNSPDLKAVGQIYCSRDILFTQLVQERILDVNGLVHMTYPQWFN
ncbi:hypothetical protein D3C73_968950 [compost metagenome]